MYGHTFRLRLAVRPEVMPDLHDTAIATVVWGNAIFYLRISNQGVGAYVGFYGICGAAPGPCGGGTFFGSRTLPPGKFSEVELLLTDADAGPPHLVVRSNGRDDIDRSLDSFNASIFPNGVRFEVGVVASEMTAGPRKIYIDDLTFDFVR